MVRIGVIAGITLLVGCSTTYPLPPESDETDTSTTQSEADDGISQTQGLHDVTQALIVEARSLTDAGQLARAIEVLERAIRIDSRNGRSWLMLAETELAQGRFVRAEQNARKAVVLLPADVHHEAWLVVARALEGQGDYDGATDIRRTWGLERF